MTTDEELGVLEQQLRRLKIEYEMYFNNPTKRPPTDIEWKVLAILRKFSDGARINFSQRFRYNSLAQQYAVQSDLWRKKSRIREEGYRRPQDALLGVQGVRIFEDKPAENSASAHGVEAVEIDEIESETVEAATAAAAAVFDKPVAPWPVGGTKRSDVKPTDAKPAATSAPAPTAAKTAAKSPARPAAKQPYSAQLTDVEKDRKRVESLYEALVEAKKNAGEKLGDAASFDSFSSFVKKKTDQIRKQYACETVEYSVELEAGKVRLKAKAGSKP